MDTRFLAHTSHAFNILLTAGLNNRVQPLHLIYIDETIFDL